MSSFQTQHRINNSHSYNHHCQCLLTNKAVKFNDHIFGITIITICNLDGILVIPYFHNEDFRDYEDATCWWTSPFDRFLWKKWYRPFNMCHYKDIIPWFICPFIWKSHPLFVYLYPTRVKCYPTSHRADKSYVPWHAVLEPHVRTNNV